MAQRLPVVTWIGAKDHQKLSQTSNYNVSGGQKRLTVINWIPVNIWQPKKTTSNYLNTIWVVVRSDTFSITPDRVGFFFFNQKVLIFLLFFFSCIFNICCWYSLEVPCLGTSNEYQQHMFMWRNKNNIMRIPLLSGALPFCM